MAGGTREHIQHAGVYIVGLQSALVTGMLAVVDRSMSTLNVRLCLHELQDVQAGMPASCLTVTTHFLRVLPSL